MVASCTQEPPAEQPELEIPQPVALAVGIEFVLAFEGFERHEVMVLSGTYAYRVTERHGAPNLPESYLPREISETEREGLREQDIPVCTVGPPGEDSPCAEFVDSGRPVLVASGFPALGAEQGTYWIPVLYHALDEDGYWMRAVLLTVVPDHGVPHGWRILSHMEWFSLN
jgi:hypothetical protein